MKDKKGDVFTSLPHFFCCDAPEVASTGTCFFSAGAPSLTTLASKPPFFRAARIFFESVISDSRQLGLFNLSSGFASASFA